MLSVILVLINGNVMRSGSIGVLVQLGLLLLVYL